MMTGLYLSPLGKICFKIDDKGLYEMSFTEENINEDQHQRIIKIKKELDGYFKGEKHTFQTSIYFKRGTSFQQEVWSALLTIPYGETRSYLDIAHQIKHPKAVRAVGQACKKNPIGIMVPCHRVIGKNGALTGYSGKHFTHLKAALLAQERT